MEAIVLSRRDFREYDQIISIYTRERGKKEILARGIKKITSKNSAHLEPFSFVDVSIANGKELDVLTTVQALEYFGGIRCDGQKSLMALYVVSLLDKVVKVGEVDERLFKILFDWLKFLNDEKRVSFVLLDAYIIVLLNCFGFSPELERCVVCEKMEELLGFCFAGGGVVCRDCGLDKKKIGEQVVEWNSETKENWDILSTGDWGRVLNINYQDKDYNKLHRVVYNFFVYTQEKKIADWSAILGEIIV